MVASMVELMDSSEAEKWVDLMDETMGPHMVAKLANYKVDSMVDSMVYSLDDKVADN